MMSDCGVCLSGYEGSTDFFRQENRRARKSDTCSECGEPIAKGDEYQYASGKSEGDFWAYKTCLVCAEIRSAFSCNGEVYGGMLWEDMRDYVLPELTTGCFARLQTPQAKAELQRRWMEWKGISE